MDEEFTGSALDARRRTHTMLRERQEALAADLATVLAGSSSALDGDAWQSCGDVVVRLFATAIESGRVDAQSTPMRDLGRLCPPLTSESLVDTLQRAERVLLDELALDARLGATSQPWPLVGQIVRRATLDILAAYADLIAGREVPIVVRDPLTTLIAAPVFELALSQEIERSARQGHPLSLLLFDIDDLATLNRQHGYGVGDRLLERLGIMARRYFRTHDWVSRYGDDSIAVLLPEVKLDQAASVASGFREMTEQRLVLRNHKTDEPIGVTVSACAVGTDKVAAELEPGHVLAEAEAAVLRAKLNGRNRIESVALLPTSLTIAGAGTLLGRSARDVTRLIRSGALKATRRGRHFHIDRANLEQFRRGLR